MWGDLKLWRDYLLFLEWLKHHNHPSCFSAHHMEWKMSPSRCTALHNLLAPACFMAVDALRVVVKSFDVGSNQSQQTVGGRWSGSRVSENPLLHQDQTLAFLWPDPEEGWGSPGSVGCIELFQCLNN